MQGTLIDKAKVVHAPRVSLGHLSPPARAELPEALGAFLDSAATGTSRATFYETTEQQQFAQDSIHSNLCAIDRGVYAAALALPGITDHARQLGILRLLSAAQRSPSVIDDEQEVAILRFVCTGLPPQRMLKLFGRLRTGKVNNARTRKLVLRSILGSTRLELWSVRYRRKVSVALTHAWGKRTSSIIRSIVAKPAKARDAKERGILDRQIGRFITSKKDQPGVEECVGFALGNEAGLTLPLLRSYSDAKHDFQLGHGLPGEVLEGIRSTYHKDVASVRVLDLTKNQLTVGQRLGVQRRAKRAGVSVAFTPASYNPVQLYLYAFEMGMTEPIRETLLRKAAEAAQKMPLRFERVAVLLDASGSMGGADTQRLRPMSVALGVRDMLCAMATTATAFTNDGRSAEACELVEPRGDTSLALGLISALRTEPDIVFVLSDGYENAPAGRMAEVVRAVRRLDIKTPIIQLSPVLAAADGGVRPLSDQVRTMPIGAPESLGLGLLKASLEIDVERGVGLLLGMVLPKLIRTQRLTQRSEVA